MKPMCNATRQGSRTFFCFVISKFPLREVGKLKSGAPSEISTSSGDIHGVSYKTVSVRREHAATSDGTSNKTDILRGGCGIISCGDGAVSKQQRETGLQSYVSSVSVETQSSGTYIDFRG